MLKVGGGIMILINNNFDKEVTKVIKDPNYIGKHLWTK